MSKQAVPSIWHRSYGQLEISVSNEEHGTGDVISLQRPASIEQAAGHVSSVNVKHGGGAYVQDFEISSAMHIPPGHEAN